MQTNNPEININTLYLTKPGEYIPVLIIKPQNEKVHANLHVQFVEATKGYHKINFDVFNNHGNDLTADKGPIEVDLQPNKKNILELQIDDYKSLMGDIALDFWAEISKGDNDFITVKITFDEKFSESLKVFIESES
ncbi:hypothetical protein M3M39_05110 [Fructilactobacillus hinvesii]|uniref:DUF2479 domain-containing protein n=1 Tax=Fructilactobacillus hinvesii TaxID=2940300 RepID=A0ABY5BQW9_9LACO|nr:hypothetical protein [Fructilactobacillus hinvesii]USS87503.1 hypothetical protein M3M39_05110 [Fructilactobacillus hinvesii]